MGTINDLLYNYQESNEFVCSDGRMSVNGICQVDQPAATVDTSNLTEEIIEDGEGEYQGGGKFGNLDLDDTKTFNKQVWEDADANTPGSGGWVDQEVTGYMNPKLGHYQTFEGKNINHAGIEVPTIAGMILDKNFGKGPQPGDIKGTFTEGWDKGIDKTLDKVESIIKKTAPKKEIEKITPKKEKFEWDFDKENKIDTYKNTVNNNIFAYNNFIEQNLGISTNVQDVARVGGTVAALAGGSGALTVAAPWAIPFLAGGAINNAERERIQNITDQDQQGDIQTVDMMTYNNPPGIVEDTPGGGEFSHDSSPDPVSDAGGDAEWGDFGW